MLLDAIFAGISFVASYKRKKTATPSSSAYLTLVFIDLILEKSVMMNCWLYIYGFVRPGNL